MQVLPILLFVTVASSDYETANFFVQASDPEIAREVAETAELLRDSLSTEWLGRRLPRWREPCRVRVELTSQDGGGNTSFTFEGGEVFGWRMRLTGSRESILADHLPRQIMHVIMASHFRCPLDEWLSSGFGMHVESAPRRALHLRQVRDSAARQKLIPLRKMLRNQPGEGSDELVQSQAMTFTTYLLHLGSRNQFLACIEAADRDGWRTALRATYGVAGLKALERDWIAWLAGGGEGRPAQRSAVDHSQRKNGRGAQQEDAELLFFMADWCGPCRSMVSVVRKLKAKGYSVRTIDVDRDRELAQEYGIRSLPTFVGFDETKTSRRLTGATSEERLLDLIRYGR